MNVIIATGIMFAFIFSTIVMLVNISAYGFNQRMSDCCIRLGEAPVISFYGNQIEVALQTKMMTICESLDVTEICLKEG